MSYSSLADFLEELERLGQLCSIDDGNALGQSPKIAQATAGGDKRALLIRDIKGSGIPLAAGLLATPARIACSLGVQSIEEISKRLAEILAPLSAHELQAMAQISEKPGPRYARSRAPNMIGLVLKCPLEKALARFAPRPVKTGACQKVVRLGRDIDFGQLPLPDGWPEETQRIITAAQLVSRDPASGRLVIAHVDLSIRSARDLAVHWTEQDPLAELFATYRDRGESMPLAVVLGGHPANLLAAMTPLPIPIDRSTLAGLLAGGPLEVVRCRTINLNVPAEAEMVIEGTIDPAVDAVETGPVATPLGHYARSRPAAVMRASALTYRANPVVPAIVHGPGSCEWTAIQRAMQWAMLPLLKVAVAEVVDVNLPECGHGRELAWVAIQNENDSTTAQNIAKALWKWPAMQYCKLTVIVDESVDVHDAQSVWSAVAKNMDPRRDVFFDDGPVDPWDENDENTPCRRMVLDATAKIIDDGKTRQD